MQLQAIRDYKRNSTPMGMPPQAQAEEDGAEDEDDEMTEEEEEEEEVMTNMHQCTGWDAGSLRLGVFSEMKV